MYHHQFYNKCDKHLIKIYNNGILSSNKINNNLVDKYATKDMKTN